MMETMPHERFQWIQMWALGLDSGESNNEASDVIECKPWFTLIHIGNHGLIVAYELISGINWCGVQHNFLVGDHRGHFRSTIMSRSWGHHQKPHLGAWVLGRNGTEKTYYFTLRLYLHLAAPHPTWRNKPPLVGVWKDNSITVTYFRLHWCQMGNSVNPINLKAHLHTKLRELNNLARRSLPVNIKTKDTSTYRPKYIFERSCGNRKVLTV